MYVFKNSKNNYFVLTLKLRSPPRLELLMVNLHKPMAINSHHFKLQTSIQLLRKSWPFPGPSYPADIHCILLSLIVIWTGQP